MNTFNVISCLVCVLAVSFHANAACPEGYSDVIGNCYKAISSPMIWREAQKVCSKYGGHLPTVYSAADNYAVNTAANKLSSGKCPSNNYGVRYWLGGVVCNEQVSWFTSPPDSKFNADDCSQHPTECNGSLYTNWSEGQPDNWKGKERCFEVASKNDQWNDKSCNTPTCFVCQA